MKLRLSLFEAEEETIVSELNGPPNWLKKPTKMHPKIWNKYLVHCELGDYLSCHQGLNENLKLNIDDLLSKYPFLLSRNLSKSRKKYFSTYNSRFYLIKESMPYYFLARIIFYLYGPRRNQTRKKTYTQMKALELQSGWQPSLVLYYFREYYSLNGEMDWDFFSKSLYIFIVKSGLIVSPYLKALERKKLKRSIKKVPVDRNKKINSEFVINEKSFLKDFGELAMLSSNFKIRKNPKTKGFKEFNGKYINQKKRLSTLLSKFNKKIESKNLKSKLPNFFKAELEFFG